MKEVATILIVLSVIAGGAYVSCTKIQAQKPKVSALSESPAGCCCADTSGMIIPVYTLQQNVTGPLPADSVHFIRSGNQVSVWGQVNVNGIVSGNFTVSSFQVDLPFASNMRKIYDLTGSAVYLQTFQGQPNTSNPMECGFVQADYFADKAVINFYPEKNFFCRMWYQFTYTIK